MEVLLHPLPLNKHPETFGPKDDDPLVNLFDYLDKDAPAEDGEKGWPEDLKMTAASLRVTKEAYAAFKDMKRAGESKKVYEKAIRKLKVPKLG